MQFLSTWNMYSNSNFLKFVQSNLLYGGLSLSYMGYMNRKIPQTQIAYRAVDEDFGSYLETYIYLMK